MFSLGDRHAGLSARRRNSQDHGARAGDPGAHGRERRGWARSGEGARGRRPLCDRSDLAHAFSARGDPRHRQECAEGCRRRRHNHLGRADQSGGRGRGQVSGQSGRARGARQGGGAIAGSVPAGLRDGLGGHGLAGAWLPGAETLSRRGGRGREAARLACSAPAGSALLPDRRHRSSESARIPEASECALRRRVVDVAEGGAGGGRLSRRRSAVARRGGARSGRLPRPRPASARRSA